MSSTTSGIRLSVGSVKTQTRLAPYFPSKEVREAHALRVKAARRAAVAAQDGVAESESGMPETTQQLPKQRVHFDA